MDKGFIIIILFHQSCAIARSEASNGELLMLGFYVNPVFRCTLTVRCKEMKREGRQGTRKKHRASAEGP